MAINPSVFRRFGKYIEDAINRNPKVVDQIPRRISSYAIGPQMPTRSVLAPTMSPEDLAKYYLGPPQAPGVQFQVLNDATKRWIDEGNEPLNPEAAAKTLEVARRIDSDPSSLKPSDFYGVDLPTLERHFQERFPMDPQSKMDRLESMGFETTNPTTTFATEHGNPAFWRSVGPGDTHASRPGHTARLDMPLRNDKAVGVFGAENPDVARTYVGEAPDHVLTDSSPFTTAYGLPWHDPELASHLGFSTVLNMERPIPGGLPPYTIPIAPMRNRVVYDDFGEPMYGFDPGMEPRVWNELTDQPMFMSDGTRLDMPGWFYDMGGDLTPEEVEAYLRQPRDLRLTKRTSEMLDDVNAHMIATTGRTVPLEYKRIMDLAGVPKSSRMMLPYDPEGLYSSRYRGTNIVAGDTTNMRSQIGLALPQLRYAPWLMGAAAGATVAPELFPAYGIQSGDMQ